MNREIKVKPQRKDVEKFQLKEPDEKLLQLRNIIRQQLRRQGDSGTPIDHQDGMEMCRKVTIYLDKLEMDWLLAKNKAADEAKGSKCIAAGCQQWYVNDPSNPDDLCPDHRHATEMFKTQA